MRSLLLFCAVPALVLAFFVTPGIANDYWWTDTFAGVGLNGRVNCIVQNGSDLVVAGTFDHVGPVFSDQVARWDGSSWHSMTAPSDWIEAFALGVYNGEVYGFGFGAGALSKWDGGAWIPVGTLAVSGYGTNIRAMLPYQGELVIAGDGGVSIDGHSGVITYDGSTFGDTGNRPDLSFGPVVDMVEYDGDLYAAGWFEQTLDSVATSGVIRWDGIVWTPVEGKSSPAGPLVEGIHDTGTGYGGLGYALAVHNGKLVIAGDFDRAGDLPASNICTWDASTMMWETLGSGSVDPVKSAASIGGTLFAVGGPGSFQPFENLMQWNGSTWSNMGGGNEGSIYALEEYNGNLAIGGFFHSAGGNQVEHLAIWNGSGYGGMLVPGGKGLDARVGALDIYDGDLVAAGPFEYAGTKEVNHVATWDGQQWSGFGGGTNASINAVLSNGTDLILGGEFTEVGGGMPANYVARWDGASWHAYGSGLPNPALAMCMHNGELYVGGGDYINGYLRRWDGAAWQNIPLEQTNRSVEALVSWGGDLIAGSQYFGSLSSTYLAKWDGAQWTALESADGVITDNVRTFYDYNGMLFVGGDFGTIGQAFGFPVYTTQHTARWDGTEILACEPVAVTSPPPGHGVDLQSARAYAEFDGRLFIGGGPSYNRGALWSSDMVNPWELTANDVNNTIFDMVPHDGRLYVAGTFTRAGASRNEPGGGTASSYIGVLSVSVTGVEPPEVAHRGALSQNQPNPFNPTTAIHYEIPDGAGEASLVIYDVRGAKVRTLLSGANESGPGTATWDGRDDAGRQVASGIYFYRLTAGQFSAVRKMVMLK